MNRTYKVIWSKARRCYVVVSELAKGQHKSSSKSEQISSNVHRGGDLGKAALAAIVASLLTFGGIPGISLAADVNGVVKTDDGSLKSVNGKLVYDRDNTNGQIALGNNATVFIGKGGQESAITPTWSAGDAAGGIAIGSNTYARTGSIMIGSHSYKGNMGDVQNIDTSKFDTSETGAYGFTVATTTIGTNSFTKGFLATTVGDYNIQSGRTEGWGASSYNYGAQNFGATVLGTLNSNESATAPIKYKYYESYKSQQPSYSGIANSIVGTANKVNNSNGTLVFGAGNTVKNSITDITGVSDSTSLRDASRAADTLRNAIKKSKSGGATLVIGGGNTAENTLKTQIIGVNNTVTGTEETPSDYNMVNAFETTVTNSSHLYTIGTNNKITNTKNTILAGDDYTNVSGLTDSVIIGNNRVSGKDDNAAFAYFNNQKNIVSIGNKNVLNSTDGSISIGNNNFMWRSGGQPEKFGYDTGNVAIGNNTYINSYLNQGDSIVIGKNATAMNMGGSLEKAFAFGTPEGKDYSGSIAIGQNSYARSGSTMIGIHNYQGELGDLDIDFTKGKNEGSSGIANYQESIDATTIGNNSYNNGVFSTVVGSYTAVSGLYHNQKWGEKPYGVQNFGAAVLGSLNSVEGLTSTEHNTAGMADSILGSANRTKNANGTIMVGAGNVVEDSINDFDASEIKTKNGIASPNDLSEAMRTSIKNANGGGAAAIVGNGNEVKKSTNVAVMGSKNSVTSTTNSQIFGDNRIVEGTDGQAIDGAVIVGSASATAPLKTDKKNVTILGYNANAIVEGGVALGAGSVASVDYGVHGYDFLTKAASTSDDKAWKSSWAAVSVGDSTHTRQITNVAAGFNETDAVNVAQLRAVASKVGSVMNLVAGDGISIVDKDGVYTISANIKGGSTPTDDVKVDPEKPGKGGNTSGSTTDTPVTPVDPGNTGNTDNPGNTGNTENPGNTDNPSNGSGLIITAETKPTHFGADSGDATAVKPDETLAIKGDTTNITTTASDHGITVSLKKDIAVDSVTAGDTKMTSDGLTITGGPSITKSGIDAGGKKVTHVADGEIAADSKDAVNGSQLYRVQKNVESIENDVTNLAGDVTNLNGRVSDLDNRVNKVGAGAAALAALHPLDFDPDDKWDFAVGYGNYRNANSVAFGAFYRPNEDTMFSLGTNFGNGENMFNAGLSFKIGQGGSGITTSKTAMAKTISSLKDTVHKQDQKIEGLENVVDTQDKKIAELEALVKEQGEMIRQYVGKK